MSLQPPWVIDYSGTTPSTMKMRLLAALWRMGLMAL
jgi:hypothetical protein